MKKIAGILFLIVVNLSCAQIERSNDKIEYNEKFIKDNGDYDGFALDYPRMYIFTSKYLKLLDADTVRIYERDVSAPIDSAKLVGVVAGRLSSIYPQTNLHSTIFSVSKMNITSVYSHSSNGLKKIFQHDRHVVWYDADTRIFFDHVNLYKVHNDAVAPLTQYSSNTSYQIARQKLYKLYKYVGKTKFVELDTSLKITKAIFETSSDFELDFRCSNNAFYFLEKTDDRQTNLIKYQSGQFLRIGQKIDNLSEGGFYVYKDFIGLINFKVDDALLGGYGGTLKTVTYSKNAGETFNEMYLGDKILVPPYIFYKDSLFMGNLSGGAIITSTL